MHASKSTSIASFRLSPVGAVEKPIGTFSSSGAVGESIYANPQLRGVLVRTSWASVEPSPGKFDFAPILAQVTQAEAQGKDWSLSVMAGGAGSPEWLTRELKVPFVAHSFRGKPGFRLPLFWHETAQARLAQLAEALAARFGDNPRLKLVYVPQMTSNGLEGHLQGVPMADMVAAGYTDARWIEASTRAAHSFARAFPTKAIAFEVHEVNGGAAVPIAIMNALWNDPTLDHRVGVAMWWISGKTTYQPDLVKALIAFPGDVYGQVIGRSDQVARFARGDYASVFAQAKQIGMRYIEPWEWEFKYDKPKSAQGAWDAVLADFNTWAEETYGPAVSPAPVVPGLSE